MYTKKYCSSFFILWFITNQTLIWWFGTCEVISEQMLPSNQWELHDFSLHISSWGYKVRFFHPSEIYVYKYLLQSIFDFMNQYYPNFDMMGWYLWSHSRTDVITKSLKITRVLTIHMQLGLQCHNFSRLRTLCIDKVLQSLFVFMNQY